MQRVTHAEGDACTTRSLVAETHRLLICTQTVKSLIADIPTSLIPHAHPLRALRVHLHFFSFFFFLSRTDMPFFTHTHVHTIGVECAGTTGSAGAVANVSNIKNPIKVSY